MSERKADQEPGRSKEEAQEKKKSESGRAPSGAGSAAGGSISPAEHQRRPEAPPGPSEVREIPIGTPDSAEELRRKKERARQPSPENEPSCPDPERE